MHGLTNYQKFLVVRPLPPNVELDDFKNPIIKKDDFGDFDWNKIKFTNLSNMGSIKNKKEYIPLMFHFDYILERVWKDPFGYLSRMSGFKAITSPDFSTYIDMNPKEIEHNVFRNKWFAAWGQYYHYKMIPTILWGSPETFDMCFSGLPKESVVIVSTIGCLKCQDEFLLGFNEMKRRLNPRHIIVRGKMIEGMTGNLIFVDFEDTFNGKEANPNLVFVPENKNVKEEE